MTFLSFSCFMDKFLQVHGEIIQIISELVINLVDIVLLWYFHSFTKRSTIQLSFGAFRYILISLWVYIFFDAILLAFSYPSKKALQAQYNAD